VRLRGQIALDTKEACKIDTLVSGKERIFFIPETNDEKDFFSMDELLGLTGLPVGPASHNPDLDWGWRMEPDTTEQHMQEFIEYINETLERVRQGKTSSLFSNLTTKKTPSVLN
jgi:hypothetical protein